MNEPNAQIISRLRELNCNAIFLFQKVSQGAANFDNLGLYEYSPDASFPPYYGKYCYRDKLTDFIHQATELQVPIKVFALQIETDKFLETGWSTADQVLQKIAHYQMHVRQKFPDKKALLNGVVTNVEPWTITSSNPVYINGTAYSWNDNFCTASNRASNNAIMNHYLSFAQFITQKLNFYGFTIPLNPYPVDNKYMGTTQWYLHYYSQRWPSEFPAGNFSQLTTGDRFNYIIPQTYCSKSDYACQGAACINPNLTSFCSGNYTDDEDNQETDLPYDESTGHCIAWFEKHFLTNFMYTSFSDYTIPLDAAPMLFGHSAWMFSTRAALREFRDNVRHVARVCYGKNNYQGSVIFNYTKAFEIPAGIPNSSIPICNTPPPDGGFQKTNGQILIYPNPADQVIYLEGLQPDDQVVLKGLLNHLNIIATNAGIINTANLPEGWYIIEIYNKTGNSLYHNKVYIQH